MAVCGLVLAIFTVSVISQWSQAVLVKNGNRRQETISILLGSCCGGWRSGIRTSDHSDYAFWYHIRSYAKCFWCCHASNLSLSLCRSTTKVFIHILYGPFMWQSKPIQTGRSQVIQRRAEGFEKREPRKKPKYVKLTMSSKRFSMLARHVLPVSLCRMRLHGKSFQSF